MMRVEFNANSPREMRLLAKFCEDLAKAREDDLKEALAQQESYARRLAGLRDAGAAASDYGNRGSFNS